MRIHLLIGILLLFVFSCNYGAKHGRNGCSPFEKFNPQEVNSNFTIVEMNQKSQGETEFLLYDWAEVPGDTTKSPLTILSIFRNNKLLLQTPHNGSKVLVNLRDGKFHINVKFGIDEGITHISLDEIIHDKRTDEEIWKFRVSNFIYYGEFGLGDAVYLVNFCRGVIGGYHSELVHFKEKNEELVCYPTGDISSLDFSKNDMVYNICDLL